MPTQEIVYNDVTLIILAGGEGRRLQGQDKGLAIYKGKPLIEYALATFSNNVAHVLISANRNIKFYEEYGHPVITDQYSSYQGPLAGIASCLTKLQTEYAFIIACDMPLIPNDLLPRLYHAKPTKVVLPHDGLRTQPLCCLLHHSILPSIEHCLSEKKNKVIHCFENESPIIVDCSDMKQSFININSANELNKKL